MSTACTASLDGAHNVPRIDTNGTGSATMEFDPSTSELSWNIEFSGLSGPATAAHFHGPAGVGINAGAQVNVGQISGLVSPMKGSAELTQEQASQLLHGQMYINVHTAANPNGEIRGQVSCESAPNGGSQNTATLAIGEKQFDIQYSINGGTLDKLTADPAVTTLVATISSTSNGNLTLWLPTKVINTDHEFAVFIDGEFGNFVVDELKPTADVRVLQIEFENGTRQIEIVGSSMVGANETESAPQKAPVKIEGQTYDISYNVTGGSVQSISADAKSKSLSVTFSSSSSGVITIWLPTNVINADKEFSVFVDGKSANFTELQRAADARVLQVQFDKGASEIKIAGTFIVPEFGTLAILVASAAILGAIVATKRFDRFGGLRI